LSYDELLLIFAFKFNMRRYRSGSFVVQPTHVLEEFAERSWRLDVAAEPPAGTYTRPLFSST
jgi:hypothetical protein